MKRLHLHGELRPVHPALGFILLHGSARKREHQTAGRDKPRQQNASFEMPH
ncbi:hypothetical protein HMI49_14660 [Corallococcus exercitus]|uniref:Uncharacterized protein n=1 Tax=Corallococcus exercitus TaxID=2316736 RepID=A0A7Y4KIQ3_9BACT|nr:hypothetical protein [Corallococcus exercitus]